MPTLQETQSSSKVIGSWTGSLGGLALQVDDKHTLKRHETSDSHVAAKMLESNLGMSREDGGIQEALATVESAEKKAMVGAMRCLYWICKKSHPPHH